MSAYATQAQAVRPHPPGIRMVSVLIVSTSDVPLSQLHDLANAIEARLHCEIDERQRFSKSLHAPSWINFLQSPEFWAASLAGGLVWDVAKAAARGAWRNRELVLRAAKDSGTQTLLAFAEGLSVLRVHMPGTTLNVGAAIPNDAFSTLLTIEGDTEASIALDLALLVAHLPGISNFLETYQRDLTGQVTLSLADDGTMLIDWMDRKTLTPQRLQLPVPDVA